MKYKNISEIKKALDILENTDMHTNFDLCGSSLLIIFFFIPIFLYLHMIIPMNLGYFEYFDVIIFFLLGIGLFIAPFIRDKKRIDAYKIIVLTYENKRIFKEDNVFEPKCIKKAIKDVKKYYGYSYNYDKICSNIIDNDKKIDI